MLIFRYLKKGPKIILIIFTFVTSKCSDNFLSPQFWFCVKILENCIYFHCNYTKLFPYYFGMNVHLLSSQTSFVHPRLLRRVDFSEATVLAVYLDQDGVHGQNFKQHLLGHLLKKTFLEEISPDLFQAKSHSSSPPSEIALQYVSGFMFTSTLEQETIVCGVLVDCINSRILQFIVRLEHSHPVAELLLRLLLTVLASHRAGPAHLGKDRYHVKDPFYNIVTNRCPAQ